MVFNDPDLVGNVLRGGVALGVMLLLAGLAARLCSTRASWSIGAGVLTLCFLWLLLGVVPHPHQAGLLYAVEWGTFGAAVFSFMRLVRAPAPTAKTADPESLLGFWFGDDLARREAVAQRSALWFGSDADFDRQIRERFGDWPERARSGEMDGWQETARGTLALAIVLDQLPRNLHRRSPDAFAFDERAREVALGGLDRGVDDDLHPVEAAFLYLPLEHAEDPDLQSRSVSLFDGLARRCTPEIAEQIDQYRDYAARHRAVIDRFGRFPHRNEVLGRESTPDEADWLSAGGDRFGG